MAAADVLVRGKYLATRTDGYANVRVSTRVAASTTVKARVGIPALLVYGDTVYMLREEITGNDWVIVASLHPRLPGGTTGISPATITLYPGTTAPTGWLLCNGSAISRTTYSTLFAIIGTSFGSGNGTTTFNLPTITMPGSGLVWIIKTN